MFDLEKLESLLEEYPAYCTWSVSESYDKIEAILATLRALNVEYVDQDFVDKMLAEIYRDEEGRCSCCGLKGGH